MLNQDLLNYINQARAEEMSDQKIKEDLLKTGWNQNDIDEAFSSSDNIGSNIRALSNKTSQKTSAAKIAVIVISVIVLLSGSVGAFYYADKRFDWEIITSKKSEKQEIFTVKNQLSNDIETLKINYVQVPATDNSASIFNALGVNPISSADDKDFLNKYLGSAYLPKNPPPLAESQKIVSKYKAILAAFETGTSKKYYQCSGVMDNQCSLIASLRNIARLATLNSFVLSKTGQTDTARQYAFKVVKLGQMLTAQADSLLNLLIGWSIQKLGYTMVAAIQNEPPLSQTDKTSLVNNLREEHKKVLRFEYTRKIEAIDYITDKNKQPSGIINQEDQKSFDIIRAEVNNITWEPNITKQWFYDSYKIALSNVDLACGSELKKSQLDINFDPNNKIQTENFVGKTFYYMSFAGADGANTKRCDIESIINVN